VGVVGQEPGDQIVSGNIGDEIAFALSSAGHSSQEIAECLPGLLADVGLLLPLSHDTHALSGGQTQRLVIGAALSAGAGLLLLDEPLAQLDPRGAAKLLEHLSELSATGVTVLMVEHRLEMVVEIADRILVMESGRLIADSPTDALRPGSVLLQTLRRLGLSIPGMLDLADRVLPNALEATEFVQPLLDEPLPLGALIFSVSDLTHRYEGAREDALRGVSLSVCAGERVAILGGNGAGKSTLIRLLGGGEIAADCVWIPQDPDLSLFCETVQDELAYGPIEQGVSPEALSSITETVAAALSISPLMARAPQSLSRGQRLRCAVAAALACRPAVLLLDEPTSGQDSEQIERMMMALREQQSAGVLLFSTHDVGLALSHATRVVVLDNGRVVADGEPWEVLSNLDAAIPIVLPPLAQFCASRGLRFARPSDLALEHRQGEQSVSFTSHERDRDTESPVKQVEVSEGYKGFDPRSRLGLVATAGILAIVLDRPLSLLIFAVLCGLPLLWMRVGWTWWRRGLVVVGVVVWSTVFSQGLFYAEQPRVSIGQIGPLHIYREGILHGLAQSLRFVGLALAGIAMTVSTPPDRMFAALVRLRIPYGLALMAATALRFMPEIGRETITVRSARAMRGRPIWRRGPFAWLQQEVSLLRPIVARSWRRAQNLAESLDVRGFDPMVPRSHRTPLVMRRRDWTVLVGGLSVCVLLVAVRVLYILYTSDVLYLSELRPLYGFVRNWL